MKKATSLAIVEERITLGTAEFEEKCLRDRVKELERMRISALNTIIKLEELCPDSGVMPSEKAKAMLHMIETDLRQAEG